MSAQSERRAKFLAFAGVVIIGLLLVSFTARSFFRRAAAAECLADDGADRTLSSVLVAAEE